VAFGSWLAGETLFFVNDRISNNSYQLIFHEVFGMGAGGPAASDVSSCLNFSILSLVRLDGGCSIVDSENLKIAHRSVSCY
jgi:hypothetical protein